MDEISQSADLDNAEPKPVPQLTEISRRILGVLIEKARTTPDAYPLSLNGLVTGCNQKSNRAPLMQLTPEAVEDELAKLREVGAVAEVHGGGRVPKYRHYASDFLGIKGIEAGVMAELMLRGAQSVGDLRSRASRFGPIADQAALQEILSGLIDRNLVITLTPAGRGQLVTHNLYEPADLEYVKKQASEAPASVRSSPPRSSSAAEIEQLKSEVASLRSTVEDLVKRIESLES
ncbi:MAG TPA: DUF480 domain-containing protein [Planctomycetaceae bacterium]|nr:DUF480 domain-containing protein [Planctomycetaceae bacterium]